MCVTRPVSRMGIIVRGRFSAGVVLALRNPEFQKGGKPHNSRATSCEGMHPNLGEQDGTIVVSFILSRSVPRGQSVDGSVGIGASRYRCTTPTG